MLAKVLESGSIAEMLQQMDHVQAIHDYDRKQLEEFINNSTSNSYNVNSKFKY